MMGAILDTLIFKRMAAIVLKVIYVYFTTIDQVRYQALLLFRTSGLLCQLLKEPIPLELYDLCFYLTEDTSASSVTLAGFMSTLMTSLLGLMVAL